MDRQTIFQLVKCAAPELRARGLEALYLFGSQVRGEARNDSDIDIAFDVTKEADKRFSLVDQASVQIRLEEIFGRKVDFVSRSGMRPKMRARVEAEMVRLL